MVLFENKTLFSALFIDVFTKKASVLYNLCSLK